MGCAIKSSNEMEIHKFERHASDDFHYNIPVTAEGTYTLITKYVEPYFSESNKRVFNLKIGSCLVK